MALKAAITAALATKGAAMRTATGRLFSRQATTPAARLVVSLLPTSDYEFIVEEPTSGAFLTISLRPTQPGTRGDQGN